jgi:hypothetical protein
MAFRQCATYHSKILNQCYNFVSDLIVIASLHIKLYAPRVTRILVMRISKLPLRSPETKSYLDVSPVERCRIYYKGEGGGFPQVWAVVSLVSSNCLWFVVAPKRLQLCTNYFVLVFCRSVWVIEACQFFIVPSRSSNTPFYSFIVLGAKERPWFLPLPLFLVWDSHLSPSRSWEHMNSNDIMSSSNQWVLTPLMVL